MEPQDVDSFHIAIAHSVFEPTFIPWDDFVFTTTAQARIDEEIAKQILSLYHLRTRRNAASLIGRLPIETLATIFIHCASDYHSQYSGGLTSTPSWVNVSYVCRHWRDVALNCATLWTYLFVTSPRWTKELLARSKQASLKIRFALEPEDIKRCGLRFVEQVMNHVERIREFHLHVCPSTKSSVNEFFSRLSSRAPRLQKLEFSARPRCSTRLSVPFNGDTPALSALVLTHCPVPWYSFKPNCLTTLSLKDVPDRLRQNVAEFLSFLRCMQDLAHLYLDHALATAIDFLSSTALHTFQKITLPRLSRLLIAAPLSTVTALLSCVNFPLDTELRLELFESTSSPVEDIPPYPSLEDYAMLSSVLARRYSTSINPALPGATIRSVVVDSPSFLGTRLTFSTAERDSNTFNSISGGWGRNIPLRITINFGQPIQTDDRIRITNTIYCSMPLTHVRTVHVIDPPSSHDFWKTMGQLQDLRYIKLSRGYMPDLTSVLSLPYHTACKGTENQDGDGDRSLEGVFAPALEELELYDIFFSGATEWCQNWRAAKAQPFFNALSTRKKPQGRLTMSQCCLTGEYGKRLDLVGEWGGGCFRVIEKCESEITLWRTCRT